MFKPSLPSNIMEEVRSLSDEMNELDMLRRVYLKYWQYSRMCLAEM